MASIVSSNFQEVSKVMFFSILLNPHLSSSHPGHGYVSEIHLSYTQRRESRLQDEQGEAVLLSKYSKRVQWTVVTSALCLSPRHSHSSNPDLLTFCQHISLYIPFTVIVFLSQSYNKINFNLHSYLMQRTYQYSHYHITSLIAGIWVKEPQRLLQWQDNNKDAEEKRRINGFLQRTLTA